MNNSYGNTNSAEIIIKKDIIAPKIFVHIPSDNEIFNDNPPLFNISIEEPHLEEIWYTIDNGLNNFTITDLTGTLNLEAWNSAPTGSITIKIYVKDTVGNIGFEAITVIKKISSQSIPGYNISILFFSLCLIFIHFFNKMRSRRK